MRDWAKYNPDTILTGTDDSGSRLVLEFSLDFENVFGRPIDIGCPKCFRNEYNKFINRKEMANNRSSYKLNPKYEGLSLGFNSKVFITSDNITDELAEKFVKEHPRGLEIFLEYPEQTNKDDSREEELKKLSRKQLNQLFGEGADAFPNKVKLVEAILEKEFNNQ